MAAQTWFISGTDTGVGKTWVSCLIIRHLRAQGIDAVGYKPICCGDRHDAEALAEASEISNLERINPVWFAEPLAPLAAAKREGRTLDLGTLVDGYEALCSTRDCVIVEGAGGWEVPISEVESMASLATAFGAPVLVVAANRLGALNHALLTCQAIEARGLECAGIVLNETAPARDDPAVQTNREVLELVLPEIPLVKTAWQARSLDDAFLKILK